MSHSYDATTPAGDPNARPRTGRVSRMTALHDLPDLYERRRRRAHPMLVAGLVFLGSTVTFYGLEALLPTSYKPSSFIGDYTEALAKARAEGELAAKLGYEPQLKRIETAAVQIQEQCRAGLANTNNLYQAAYSRANTFAQATADIQKQYAYSRYQTVQGTLGGETSLANLFTMLGAIGGVFDPEFGQRSMEAAEAARQQALAKLDEAARGGITVSVEGWDDGLPDPASLPSPASCDLPASIIPSASAEG